MTSDDAMHKAYGLGIASVPYEYMDENSSRDKVGEIYNFGVYKYGKNNKSVKCVLQIDCQEEELCLLQHGLKQRSYGFDVIKNIDSVDDSTRIIIQFKNGSDLEIDPGSLEDKNRISRQLGSILDQRQYGTASHRAMSLAARRSKVILEGVLEKKGHSAAFLIWTKRFVRIMPGELMYFRVGDQHNESSALSIIPLVSGEVFLKKQDINGFSLMSKTKEYSFALSAPQHQGTERERDSWLVAIQEALNPSPQQVTVENEGTTQESFLKNIINSLTGELEQLGVILNVIDAPIRASTQVKKVREIVNSLNDQTKMGLLSWTLRSSHEADEGSNSLRNNNSFQNNNRFAETRVQVLPARATQKGNAGISASHCVGEYANISPQLNNELHFSKKPQPVSPSNEEKEISNDEYLRVLLPEPTKCTEVSTSVYANSQTNERSGVKSEHPQYTPMENLVNEISNEDYTRILLPDYNAFPDYAKVQKESTSVEANSYFNLQMSSYDSDIVPPLPPKYNDSPSLDKKFVDEKHCSGSTSEVVENNLGTYDSVGAANDTNIFKSNKNLETEKESNLETFASPLLDQSQPPVIPAPPPNVPAPPPLPGLQQVTLQPKSNVLPSCKMKQLFWSKIPDVSIMSSFWKETDDRTDALNLEKLEKLFQIKSQTEEKDKLDDETNLSKPQAVSLINPRKAQNLGIFLSGFKLNNVDVESKLSLIDEKGCLSSEEIVALRRFQPTMDEIEMYKSYKGDILQMTDVDKFMVKLCNIPQLGMRLDVLLTIRELPDEIEAIKGPVESVLQACTSLDENKNFRRLLEYILALGNYVNSRTNRGGAHGFKLGALVKLAEVRSNDKKSTLLDYLVCELLSIDREAVTCFKEMPALLVPIEVSIKGLVGEVQIMRKELQSLEKKTDEGNDILDSVLCNKVKEFVMNYSSKIDHLEISCDKLQRLSSSLKKEFGESSSSDYESWLSGVGNFIKQLQRAVESAEYNQVRLASKTSNEMRRNRSKVAAETNDELKSKQTIFLQNENKYSGNELKVISEMEQIINKKEKDPVSTYDTKIFQALPYNGSYDDFDNDTDSFPTKSGILEKLSGGKKRNPKWDRRFFELTSSGYLQYSKKQHAKLAGAIYLRGCPMIVDPQNSRVLKIMQNGREWCFRGENELEVLDWFNAISYYSQREGVSM